MKDLVKEGFSYHLFILKFFGLVPIKNYEKWFRFHSLFIFIFFTLLLPILSISTYFTERLTLEKLSQSAFVNLELCFISLKSLPFLIYGPQMSAMIYELNQSVFTQVKQRQECILKDGKNICRQSFLIFFINITASAIFYAIAPIITKSGRTPIDIWTPFEKSYGSALFVISYLYVFFGTLSTALQSIALDTLLAGLVYQMTCQVKILKDNLTYLDIDADVELLDTGQNLLENERRNKKSALIIKYIKQNVVHHQAIIKFIENYKKYFSFAIFSQFLGNCVTICACIYLISWLDFLSPPFMFVISFLFGVLFQTFIYCVCGATLFEESSAISTAIYMGNWYEYDLPSRKLLITLMERASWPLIVTLATILDLSLSTFTMIVRRGYSFYAVLSQYK